MAFDGDYSGIHWELLASFSRSLETCDKARNCHADADCVLERTELGPAYVCRCRPGFHGTGYHCSELELRMSFCLLGLGFNLPGSL